MVVVLGFDIGGANTKAALINIEKSKVTSVKVAMTYFPVWKNSEKLSSVFLSLKNKLGAGKIDAIGVTMTAELSDVYMTKREGVCQILTCVKESFPDISIYVLNIDAKIVPLGAAIVEPLSVAAANWTATGWLVSQRLRECVIVDVGSTSTSIIPVAKGQLVALGKTDLDKLICGELVYTGSLRTNVAAIVHSVPLRGEMCCVSSELFALSGDVHLVLGNITEHQYTTETADGRGKTIIEAQARLSRVVCADTEMLTEQEIINIAQFIYNAQVQQVAEALCKVYSRTVKLVENNVPVVVTGLGKDFIAKKAAQQIGVNNIVDLASMVPERTVVATPAFGVALMVASKIEGENVNWTQQ